MEEKIEKRPFHAWFQNKGAIAFDAGPVFDWRIDVMLKLRKAFKKYL